MRFIRTEILNTNRCLCIHAFSSIFTTARVEAPQCPLMEEWINNTWGAQSAKHPTPGLSSGHDLMGCGREPCVPAAGSPLSRVCLTESLPLPFLPSPRRGWQGRWFMPDLLFHPLLSRRKDAWNQGIAETKQGGRESERSETTNPIAPGS